MLRARLAPVFVIAAAAASMAQAPRTPQPPPQGAVTGVVVDGSTGAVVPDAIVSLAVQGGTTLPPGYATRQQADAKGRFAFLNLANDGTYQISAAKYGYLDGGYGRDDGPASPLRTVVVEGGGWTGNLRVMLWRPATISGTVRDERGEPVVGVFVRTLARVRVAGRDEVAAGPVAVTDDYGRYRISGLLRGRYFVQVPSVATSVPSGTRVRTPSANSVEGMLDGDGPARLVVGGYPLPPPSASGRAMTYGPSFHPSAIALRDATPVDVGFGDDRAGIDVVLTPVPAVRVSGTVEGPPNAFPTLTLRLLPAGLEQTGLGADVAMASVNADGTFTFLNVPAGTYTLDAPVTFNELTMRSGPGSSGAFLGSFRGNTSLPSPPQSPTGSRWSQETGASPGVNLTVSSYGGPGGNRVPGLTGRTPVTVGATDASGVVLRLSGGATVRGRLVVETDPAKPAPPAQQRFTVFLDPASGHANLGQPSTAVSPANSADFELPGVQPAEYFVRVQAFPGPWQVKSIQWRDRDLTTSPLDATATDDLSGVVVTVTNLIPTLTGAVRDARGMPSDAAIVVAFPAQPAMRLNTGLWPTRLAAAPISSSGTFRITSLPAGEYFVAAIDAARVATWREPEVLTQLERAATRVTLAWGQTTTRDLTATGSR